jgi:hypothetical protein
MRKMKKLVKAVLILMAMLTLTFVSSFAAFSFAEQVGVSVGDWVKYKVIRQGKSSAAWTERHAEWIRIEVLNVSGSSVNVLKTWYYQDGKTYNRTHNIDVMKLRGDYCHVTRANLTVGDEVFDETFQMFFNDTVRISQITSRTYGGENREVCLAELSYSQAYFGDVLNVHEKYWWDRETGILLETTLETTIERLGNDSKSTQSLTVAETSLWETHTPPSPILPLAVLGASLAVVVVGAAVALKKRKEKIRSATYNT